jgi:altronate hydrolase
MSSAGPSVLQLHPDDGVAVALRDLDAGEPIDELGVTVRAVVPRGHKVAVHDLGANATVRKYGQVIGIAAAPIAAGEHVHVHNLALSDLAREHEVGAGVIELGNLPSDLRTTFAGFRRADGRAATRNYVGVLSSVNCSATVSRMIATQFSRPAALDGYPNVDGVVALTHGTGCGMAADGAGLELLRRTITGYARNANFSALLLVGLGCEVNQISALTADVELPDTTSMTIQELGGTAQTIREGVDRLEKLLPEVNDVRREPIPVAELVLGLQCGGSDAYSGITANPALGVASDLLVSAGGTAILGETPEVYGAEHLLTRRATSPEVAERLLERIRWWERYTAENGGSMDNNPSPGNKAGGLTTILEKSLGAVAKSGRAPLTAVYEFAEQVRAKGLVFMDTPGYDPVSVTGMVAGGANVVCFTTGRGSVFGCKPVPSLKLATNSDMYERMRDDMDLNCGDILDGEVSVDQAGRRIYDALIDVASGTRTASERLGFGDEEFAPWQLGAVM